MGEEDTCGQYLKENRTALSGLGLAMRGLLFHIQANQFEQQAK